MEHVLNVFFIIWYNTLSPALTWNNSFTDWKQCTRTSGCHTGEQAAIPPCSWTQEEHHPCILHCSRQVCHPMHVSQCSWRFDELFKSHFVFGTSYNKVLHNMQTFIQTTIYEIDVRQVKETPRVLWNLRKKAAETGSLLTHFICLALNLFTMKQMERIVSLHAWRDPSARPISSEPLGFCLSFRSTRGNIREAWPPRRAIEATLIG